MTPLPRKPSPTQSHSSLHTTRRRPLERRRSLHQGMHSIIPPWHQTLARYPVTRNTLAYDQHLMLHNRILPAPRQSLCNSPLKVAYRSSGTWMGRPLPRRRSPRSACSCRPSNHSRRRSHHRADSTRPRPFTNRQDRRQPILTHRMLFLAHPHTSPCIRWSTRAEATTPKYARPSRRACGLLTTSRPTNPCTAPSRATSQKSIGPPFSSRKSCPSTSANVSVCAYWRRRSDSDRSAPSAVSRGTQQPPLAVRRVRAGIRPSSG
ncbi:hypothetical protein C8Q78DRAFT_528451 [Trametes maxima]|nr:hypothetical protein C8Q78DRAFT_528451 [Trametes maxima]